MPPQLDMTDIVPQAIVVMGVSGSGKSTLGRLLADQLGSRFLEGDAFHSAESVAKMRGGRALDDADRRPWLDRLGDALGRAAVEDGIAVAACSALKHDYRDRLRRAADVPLAFVLLEADRDELARRVANRPDHYMPPSLLDSQLALLERPSPGERAIALDARRSPTESGRIVCDWLREQRRRLDSAYVR